MIESQRKRLGTKRGFIAVKPNCSIQSFVPAIHPLLGFGPTRKAVSRIASLRNQPKRPSSRAKR